MVHLTGTQKNLFQIAEIADENRRPIILQQIHETALKEGLGEVPASQFSDWSAQEIPPEKQVLMALSA